MTDAPVPVRVLKFGGTSVADSERIRTVVGIVRGDPWEGRRVVVVSALGGVTNALLEAAGSAAAGESGWEVRNREIVERHGSAAAELARPSDRDALARAMDGWAGELRDLLHGISLVRECTPRTLDSVLAFGELNSSALVAAAFRTAGVEAHAVDARGLLITDDTFGAAIVDREATDPRVREQLAGPGPLPVVTGFLAATPRGETTTLGRGGSDYTAALIGAALGAERVEIWTDVDGVMSADPRLVGEAFSLPGLSYEELMELSHFGAKVVHPPSVHPARERGIPLLIRNTLRPAFPGTLVSPDAPVDRGHPIRGISSIPDVALLRLEGDGMVGVPGVAGRLFGALAGAGVSVILISQASSEHSICFAVDPGDVTAARRVVDREFSLERKVGVVDSLVVEEGQSVVAAVGEGMRETPGIAGRLFSVLGAVGINVRAIAQGSSELNISLVVSGGDQSRAVAALHDAFFRTGPRPTRIFLIGTGRVGSALLRQLAEGTEGLERRGTPVLLAGLADSRRGAVAVGGLDPAAPDEALERGDVSPEEVIEAARSGPGRRILVDCTASERIPGTYDALLEAGAAVVTANKRAFAGPMEVFGRLAGPEDPPRRIYFETTVCAGLPVLRTVADLRDAGDGILAVEGVLSGTLGYLFDRLMAGDPFSQAVREAHRSGLTEPDPRDDLSGEDVRRKLLILARLAGMRLEPEDVSVEAILPGTDWRALHMEVFWERLTELDGPLAARRDAARKAGERLAYLASVRPEEGRATVSIATVGPSHPCASLRGADNLVAVTTRRYPTPVVVRGAGAGPEVTAAGVFADILRAIAEWR